MIKTELRETPARNLITGGDNANQGYGENRGGLKISRAQ